MTDFYCDQILAGKLQVDVVFETEFVVAFHHTKPYFERHIVIIPKSHINSFSAEDLTNTQAIDLVRAIQHVSRILEQEYGGCRVCSNVGAYQDTKHLHVYVHAGKRLRAEDGSPMPEATRHG